MIYPNPREITQSDWAESLFKLGASVTVPHFYEPWQDWAAILLRVNPVLQKRGIIQVDAASSWEEWAQDVYRMAQDLFN